MLTYKIDSNLLITYYEDDKAFPDSYPWGEYEGAKNYAEAVCDLYNDPVKNPDNVKYPEQILTSEQKARKAGLILPN